MNHLDVELESFGSLLNFWHNSHLHNLKKMALKILTASGSSAKIETAFSLVTLSFGCRRTRLLSENLEKEGMIRFNKDLL